MQRKRNPSDAGEESARPENALAELILYEDNHLCAVNKPAGMLTQDDGTSRENLQGQIASFLGKRDGKSSAAYLHAVHRIDKAVSGVVLFAKSSKALSRLHLAFREQQVEKEYLARVEGVVQADEATLVDQLAHGAYRAHLSPDGGAYSELSYRTFSRERATSLLLIALKTGRYHQIRAQLAAAGHPILGDCRYGAQRTFDLSSGMIALHSYRLIVPYPVRKETQKELLTIEAAPPSWAFNWHR